MEAGQTTDILVKEKVMGSVWDETRCRVCGWPLVDTIENGCIVGSCSQRPIPSRRADAPRAYSTDIAEAMSVVARMRADGWYFQLNDRNGYDEMPFWAEFATEGFEKGGQGVAASLPLAICIAALQAIGEI